MSNANCLFCKIIGGEIPGDFVYQDEQCVVIRDINPQAPTHVLVIPREHVASLNEASNKHDSLLGKLLLTAAKVAGDLGHQEYRTVINTGAAAGQSVFHIHVHVLGGRRLHWPPG
ncbi:MAG TPA: histidine triad nucleotide-binding protein [Pyrinomonadaceae bacterium]|jgi:histidine triad (HIT) family protein